MLDTVFKIGILIAIAVFLVLFFSASQIDRYQVITQYEGSIGIVDSRQGVVYMLDIEKRRMERDQAIFAHRETICRTRRQRDWPAPGVKKGRAVIDELNGPGAELPHSRRKIAVLADGFVKDLFTTGVVLQRLDYDVFIVNSAEDALKLIEAGFPR